MSYKTRKISHKQFKPKEEQTNQSYRNTISQKIVAKLSWGKASGKKNAEQLLQSAEEQNTEQNKKYNKNKNKNK